MNYKVINEIFVLFLCLIVSGYFIYIGIRKIRRVPFIVRGFSNRAGRVLSSVCVFGSGAINSEFDMSFLVPTLCLLILFFIFLYIDYKKYYLLYIHNIEEEILGELFEEYFKDKDVKVEIIERSELSDSLHNEVRIYKSKHIKNIRILKRDFELYISHMKYKKFRVMGLFNILFGVGFMVLIICLYIKFHM